MARVTVEDCVLRISNRFDLVMVAAQRSRDVSSGAQITLDRDNDKNPVVALREIAEQTIPIDEIRESLVRGLQRHVEVDEPEEDSVEDMIAEDTTLDSNPIGIAHNTFASRYDEDTANRMGMNIRQSLESSEEGFEDVEPTVLNHEN